MARYIELINEVKESVRGYANEIVHQMKKDEVEKVHDIIAIIDDLTDELNQFEDMIDGVWARAEQEVF